MAGTKAELRAALEKIPDDEPIFIVRAQDKSASFLVRYWAQMALSFGVSVEKRLSATERAAEFDAWEGKKKVPD